MISVTKILDTEERCPWCLYNH
uniref:Uncharacterized protein n=1 Tax=Rhizophora mucronata TaxID=61149 RepID=A0A2P2II58_RHIMU